MADTGRSWESGPSVEEGYELSDLKPKRIAQFGVALFLTITVVLWAAYGLYRAFHKVEKREEGVSPRVTAPAEIAPGPRLLVVPGKNLREMRAAEEELLNSYGWVDRDKGIVRIPVDRAMELLAKRGLAFATQNAGKEKPKTMGTGNE